MAIHAVFVNIYDSFQFEWKKKVDCISYPTIYIGPHRKMKFVHHCHEKAVPDLEHTAAKTMELQSGKRGKW